LRTIVTLAIETGMRRGELASLLWEDVNLKKQTAHLPKTKTDVPRTIPLSKAAVASLKAFGVKDEGRVFSLQGEPASPIGLTSMMSGFTTYAMKQRADYLRKA
jgi:integrase